MRRVGVTHKGGFWMKFFKKAYELGDKVAYRYQ